MHAQDGRSSGPPRERSCGGGACCAALTRPPLCEPAAQKHNEEKLNEAFRQKCGVFLVFSVNNSGHFQGYARMMSYVSRDQVRFA